MSKSSTFTNAKIIEVERLSDALKNIQDIYNAALERQEIQEDVQNLEYGSQHHYYGLAVSDAVFRRGQWLSDLDAQLEKVAKEIEDLESLSEPVSKVTDIEDAKAKKKKPPQHEKNQYPPSDKQMPEMDIGNLFA